MHIFHKWTKWSEVRSEPWAGIITSGPSAGKEFKSVKEVQTRECSECGAKQKRYL